MDSVSCKQYPPKSIDSEGEPTLISGYFSPGQNTWRATISGSPYGNGVYKICSSSCTDAFQAQWLLFKEPTDVGNTHWQDNYDDAGSFIRGEAEQYTLTAHTTVIGYTLRCLSPCT